MDTYKAVIFDLDGTLLNTLGDLADAVNYMLRELNLPEKAEDEVRRAVGNGIGKLIERVLPENARHRADEALSLFSRHYAGHMEEKTAPYPGVTDLLRKLKAKGIRIGVLSNKKEELVKSLCEKYFGELVDVARGEREGVPIKPEPDAVHDLLKALNVCAEDALYSGDSDVDVQTARNADLLCLAVSWGFRPIDSLKIAGASVVIDRAEEFIPAMDALYQRGR